MATPSSVLAFPHRAAAAALACAAASIFAALPTRAAAPAFNNVTQGQFDELLRDFSADSAFSSVSPASSLGSVWGFELGVLGGVANTPNVNTLAQQADPNAKVSYLPHAGLLGALTVPLGLTAEVVFMPAVSVSGVSYAQTGGALKWTFTDEVIPLPFSMAVKGFYTTTRATFSQTIQNQSTLGAAVTAEVELKDALYGLQLLASQDLLFIEPYLGIGWARANGSAGVSGSATATIFSPSFTSGQNATSTTSSTQLIVGANLKLAFIRLGAEYMRLFDTSRYTAKLSVAF